MAFSHIIDVTIIITIAIIITITIISAANIDVTFVTLLPDFDLPSA